MEKEASKDFFRIGRVRISIIDEEKAIQKIRNAMPTAFVAYQCNSKVVPS